MKLTNIILVILVSLYLLISPIRHLDRDNVDPVVMLSLILSLLLSLSTCIVEMAYYIKQSYFRRRLYNQKDVSHLKETVQFTC